MSWVWAAIISFFSALGGHILGKIVSDSLPDMSIRSLIKYTKKTFVYSRFFLVFGTLLLLKKIGKITPAMERQLNLILLVIGVAVLFEVIQKWSEKNNLVT